MENLLDIRHAIQTFLEEKLQGEVQGAGISIQSQMADVEVQIDDKKYMITIEEM